MGLAGQHLSLNSHCKTSPTITDQSLPLSALRQTRTQCSAACVKKAMNNKLAGGHISSF